MKNMFRLYGLSLEVVRELGPVIRQIERRDRDHARQLRRASKSVSLNLAEGWASTKGHKTARYQDALGSARETMACLEVAEADGILDLEPLAQTVDKLDHVIGGCVRLTR